MTAPATHKALRSTLTKITTITACIVRDAEYWTTNSGQSLNAHNQSQGQAALKRQKGKLRRQIKKAVENSYLVDDTLGAVVRNICETTVTVLACCDHFPRSVEWPGQEPLRRQVSLIETARSLLKQRVQR